MNLQDLATPIYQRAILYLTVLHALAFGSAFLVDNSMGLLLAMLAVFPYVAAMPGSLLSLAVFKILLARVDSKLPPAEIYKSIHLKALASCGTGAVAIIVALCGIIGEPDFLGAGWWYLIVPAACTWLAVFQKRKSIYAAIAEARHAEENILQQS